MADNLLKISFLILFISLSCIPSNSQILELTLSARDLPSMDVLNGPPDPYAVVYFSGKQGEQYENQGSTKYIQDRYNVEWPEVFLFNYNSTLQQRVKIDVMDDDIDEDDYIGYIEFYLSELMGSFGYTMEKKVNGPKPDSGYLKVIGRFAKNNDKSENTINASNKFHV